MSLYLGIDASTQSIDGMVIDCDDGSVKYYTTVKFDDIPGFACTNGVLESADPLVKHSDPLLWLEGLERVLDQLREQGLDFSAVKAISGSGQQHGTVYLNRDFLASSWQDSDHSLVETFQPLLSRRSAPIWMDSSTTGECREIAEAVGGRERVQKITGSPPVERFSGPQIRKFYKHSPEQFRQTAAIHLVSSFLASVLAGCSAAIDCGDGAGMNLMNLETCDWDSDMLRATAPGLESKLPSLTASNNIAGRISPWFQKKYGFKADTKVIAWSGDNPNALIGCGGYAPGTAVISLGTSYTFFAAMRNPKVDPAGYGHVFGNPAGGFMSLICFKNGALAQEEVMKQFGISYSEFEEHFFSTPPGNNGNMMLPFFIPEITPLVLEPEAVKRGDDQFVRNKAPASAVRAVVEAQAMNLRLYSNWIEEEMDLIRVTGGAAKSDANCQALADVFNAAIERLQVANAPALGAAMRCAEADNAGDWQQLTESFCQVDKEKALQPIPENVAVYENLVNEYRQFSREYI
ncbi:MAG: xylulokinase [Lentisphaeria bacterium]